MSDLEGGITQGAVSAPDAAAPAVSAPDTTAVSDAGATGAEVTPEGEAKAGRTYSQKEFDDTAAQIRRKEQRRAERFAYERVKREFAESEAEKLREQLAGRQDGTKPGPAGKPKADQYTSWEEYNEALIDWRLSQAEAKKAEAGKGEADQKVIAERKKSLEAKIIKPGKEKYKDFEEVVNDPALGEVMTDPMGVTVLDSKISHEILYYLGTHLEEAERIASLSPAQQVREIDKIEASFTKPPEVTKAPEPIKPNVTSGKTDKDYGDLSWNEFVQRRRREEKHGGLR